VPSYPMPNENAACQCRGNPMKAFGCPWGHMLECHFPYTCEQAGCEHLGRYDIEPSTVAEIKLDALAALKGGGMPPYTIIAGTTVSVDEAQLPRLEEMLAQEEVIEPPY
jgi:hypothetical protein